MQKVCSLFEVGMTHFNQSTDHRSEHRTYIKCKQTFVDNHGLCFCLIDI